MQIVEHEKAPKELVRLIKDHYETITPIEKVILVGGTELLHGKMGVFVADTGSVIIDMKACVTDQRWMAKGMNYVANVWCNLIYTVFHEGAHAQQMMDEEINFDEATWDVQHEILDHAADTTAMERMLDWFEDKSTPAVEDLGWVGKQIQMLFSSIYHKAPDLVNKEMEVWSTGMTLERAAQVPTLEGDIEMLTLPHLSKESAETYKRLPEISRLLDAVFTGNAGVMVNQTPCLKVGEALELLANRNRS